MDGDLDGDEELTASSCCHEESILLFFSARPITSKVKTSNDNLRHLPCLLGKKTEVKHNETQVG